VFTKNRPLQLDAYLESLYRFFAPDEIRTFIIYKVELFTEQYEAVFGRFADCVVIREGDFHSDVISVIGRAETKYTLFGIDDVVFHDSVALDVIDKTFDQRADDIFGFTLRLDPESVARAGDVITPVSIAEQNVYKLDWRQGRTPHSRYPFELCSTFYKTEMVKRIIHDSMSQDPVAGTLFKPNSPLVKCIGRVCSTRALLKSFGYFFSPNTLESWLCRWVKKHPDDFPGFTYFQRLCASAIQVNMVNTSTKNTFCGSADHTVEALNEKYRQGYRLDIDYVRANRPSDADCGPQVFKLTRQTDQEDAAIEGAKTDV